MLIIITLYKRKSSVTITRRNTESLTIIQRRYLSEYCVAEYSWYIYIYPCTIRKYMYVICVKQWNAMNNELVGNKTNSNVEKKLITKRMLISLK